MKILFALVILAFYTLQAQGQKKFGTCARAWTKIGCFRDSRDRSDRVLPEMLLNDRDENSYFHEPGYRLDWHRWSESTHSLACRCAERARQKGYTFFGLQYYGECWSGKYANITFNREGKALDQQCLMNLAYPTECVQPSNQECVGKDWTNYVYELQEDECQKGIDIGIILDSSGSVGSQNYQLAKSFTTDLVDKLYVSDGSTHVAVIHYNHQAFVDWDFNNNRARNIDNLKAGIQQLRYHAGWTRTDIALEKAWYQLFKPGQGARSYVPHVLLVFTDGMTNEGSKAYNEVLAPLVNAGVRMIAVGIGEGINHNELQEIANGDDTNVVHVFQFADLVEKLQTIYELSCFFWPAIE